MLYCLMDGHARTSTELAIVGEVSPATASAHLNRLLRERLIQVTRQGRHRYYSLAGRRVAAALEGLMVLAGGVRSKFVPNTPHRLRAARTCYDHMAGSIAVSLNDRLQSLKWLGAERTNGSAAYGITVKGESGLAALGINVTQTQSLRRNFACPCLDWSERRPHLGGALGAALLDLALKRKWLNQDLDSRALSVTRLGQRELLARFGIEV